jgi:flagellar basal-body rod protein FlgF
MGTGIRPTGLDSSAAALRYWERRQDVVANNLANVSTDRFKGERAFARLLSDGTTPAIDTATDLRPGTMTPTGAPLDIGIAHDGFLVVGTPKGERLTRGGSMSIDAEHRLVDESGNPLLGEDDANGGTAGPVVIANPKATIQIDSGGAVLADGHQVARLRVEQVPPGTRLQHEGNGLFDAPASRQSVGVDQRSVLQGVREESNVTSIESLVDMIGIQRAYGTVQKAITTIDSARGIATSELAKPV